MVTEIKKKEIMTLQQLKEKYAKKWISYVIVDEKETVEGEPESIMCYAVFVADTEDEIYKHPDPEFGTRSGGIASGYSVVFPMEIGGIYCRA